ncbi:type 3 dihydrofolate reductase [Celerinatantimonas diazotrophica]|uniref:Dihydrofolate reductase n=1 Tax=Celerinatantimonas diazotrophica TaxID=412034 RepID=A0A4R1KGE1_9GAMM|nr:type 3 dihydrofolate reductase [Celerinatantimonas diazotrophica]TCK63257.1 dihydrofolate reductase [Celerinatantimonas diazotrophica]CAG9295626.1 IS1595 family transposase ISSsu9 [Celerinatantimonas diazotrophica]
MLISMIAAMANNRVIGRGNQMPWYLPADLKHFKQTTLGKPIVMGRKTYESIGRALPGRHNYVLTRDSHWQSDGVIAITALQQAIELEQLNETEELVIIGGGELYRLFLPFAQRLYLTFIDLNVGDADTFFPDYEPDQWQVSVESAHQADEHNPYNYRFVQFERR